MPWIEFLTLPIIVFTQVSAAFSTLAGPPPVMITYVWTHEGWLDLAVVIDLYSRKVVGGSMGRRLTSTLDCETLQMALWWRHPPKGQLIHHSDRRVQYASEAFGKLLKTHGIEGSMSR